MNVINRRFKILFSILTLANPWPNFSSKHFWKRWVKGGQDKYRRSPIYTVPLIRGFGDTRFSKFDSSLSKLYWFDYSLLSATPFTPEGEGPRPSRGSCACAGSLAAVAGSTNGAKEYAALTCVLVCVCVYLRWDWVENELYALAVFFSFLFFSFRYAACP